MVNSKPVQTKAQLAILGWGREGKSLISYIRTKWGRSADVTILDKNPIPKSYSNVLKNMRMITGSKYLENLRRFDIIFRSPGIHYLNPEIQKAERAGTLITSPTQVFFDEVKSYKLKVKSSTPTIVGVTGTKGKGTTATLLCNILKASGYQTLLAGNIGNPMLGELAKAKQMDYVVLELSSFQLQDLIISPDIAVILDITPDHLDVHKNFREYAGAKMSITRFQNKNGRVFLFPGNKSSTAAAHLSKGRRVPVSRTTSPYFKQSELHILGAHSFANANMAATVARSLGCPKETIRKTVLAFKGIEHRLELVRTMRYTLPIRQAQNKHATRYTISFYNDSASTNPETAAAAIKSFTIPTVLIVGGKDKGLNYSPLTKVLKKSSCRAVVLFGENKLKIRKQIVPTKIPNGTATTLVSAVSRAHHVARIMIRRSLQPTNYNLRAVAIIFSPASASFDMFKDYADRGQQFKKAVRALQ
ncbi:MAG: UDP-N-acetylmuramoyl-L-alanine--D-glutamate ligase [bacterium]|nr:UDP-N-acetylmuramoyl-L-alanine--D-glutamate ligase [bacterium]